MEGVAEHYSWCLVVHRIKEEAQGATVLLVVFLVSIYTYVHIDPGSKQQLKRGE